MRLRGRLADPAVRYAPDDAARRALAEATTDVLLDVACDRGAKWWARVACAKALADRSADGVLARVAQAAVDPRAPVEVATALLALVRPAHTHAPEAAPLLAWLRARADEADRGHGLAEAALAARARLGDETAAPALSLLAFDPWPHRRAIGEQTLDVLLDARGASAMWKALGVADAVEGMRAARPCDRSLAVRLAHRDGLDVTGGLADADVGVASATSALLAADPRVDDARLHEVIAMGRGALRAHGGVAPPTGEAGACAWAMCALVARGHDVRALYAACGAPRVPIDVLDDVRVAILRAFAPGHRGTDPRHVLEHACLPAEQPYGVESSLARAVAALSAAGCGPSRPRDAGAARGQGEGTYHEIAVDEGVVQLSALGPFFQTSDLAPRAHRALAAAGFRAIDGGSAAVVFTGLRVYFFGDRAPLPVADLLFYWQD